MDILSHLPKIYDVTTSDINWTEALDAFCYACGAKGASLFSSDNTDYPFRVQALSGFYNGAENVLAEYFSLHEQIDTQAAVFTFQQEPFLRISDDDIWPGFIRFRQRPDLKYLAENFGIFRRAAFNLSTSKGWNAAIALHYDICVKEFNVSLSKNSNILAPHLGKALEINRFHSKLRHKYKAVLSVLDNVDVGICVALQNGEIITHNTNATQIFNTDDGISLNRLKRISTLALEKDREITEAIFKCSGTARGQQNIREISIFAKRKSEAAPYLIEITPLRDGADELNDNISGAQILIIDPDKAINLKTKPFTELYELTPKEAEILERLFHGLSEADIAEAQNITLNTMRNQRKSIYSKTNVRSRAELIRKATILSPPVE